MTRSVKEIMRCVTALVTITTLASCASALLPKAAAPLTQYALHDLRASTGTPAPRNSTDGSKATLIVGELHAAPGFDTQQIVYVNGRDRIDSFALSRWVGTPASMLRPLLVRALDRSGSFGAVLEAPTAANGTWRLDTDLIRLQQDFTSTPSRVRITLRVVLIDSATRQVVATRIFDSTVDASTDDTVGGVAAANQAADAVLADVASFCTDAVRRSR